MPAPIVYAVLSIVALTAKLSKTGKSSPRKGKESQETVEDACDRSSVKACPGGKNTKNPKLKPQNVPCFNKNKKGNPKEYDRQLNDQQNGLNNLTAEEYLKGREAYSSVKRKSTADKRNEFKEDLIKDYTKKEGMSKAKATQVATEKMKTLHALHNPDLIAGGKDVTTTMGDKSVNQSIGSQWKKRVEGMDKVAKEAVKKGQENVTMNVKLTRCK